MKKFFIILLAATFFSSILMMPFNSTEAAFNKNRLMDDSIFDDSDSMSAGQIDSFLNSFPSSCLSTNNGFLTPNPIGYNPTDGFLYGSNVSAGTAIYNSAQAYDLNPKVLLATLQKEQSLVSGGAGCYPNVPNASWPSSSSPAPNRTFQCAISGETVTCTYACPYSGGCIPIALGNDCPGYCSTKWQGFTKQVIYAAWKLKFWEERSKGNVDWNIQKSGWDNSDDLDLCYSGAMTQGYRKRCQSDSTAIYYDGYTTVNNGGTTVHLDTGATAALYRYTPFTSGNQSFYNIYTGWFGNPVADTTRDTVFVGDWNGNGEETPAVKRGAEFFFDNNNDGTEDAQFGLGRATDGLIVGDWDDDGRDEIGLRRGNKYYLDGNMNGSAEIAFTYGRSTDQTVVGDWNGDGRDTVGVKRGNRYYLNNGHDGTAEIAIYIGRADDRVFVGDWDGDGDDNIGLRRDNKYYLDPDNDGRAEIAFGYGRATDGLMIGDWDGDGDDNIGLRRGTSYYLSTNNANSTQFYVSMGRATDKVVVGDWDGDGNQGIGLKRGSYYYLDDDKNSSPETVFLYTY